MPITKKDDIIRRTSYVRQLDDTSGLGTSMENHSAIQHIWVKDAPGTDIGVLEDIAASCDTAAEIGSPDIDTTNLEIKRVQVVGRGCDANGGKAHVIVYWGRKDQLFGGGKGIKSAWVEPFWHTVKRHVRSVSGTYVPASGADTTIVEGDNGPIYEEVQVPAAYLYDLTIQTNVPATWDTNVGTFQSLTGVPDDVLKHFPDITQYKSGSSTAVYIVNKYEWRMKNFAWEGTTVNGWIDESVGPDNVIIEVSPDGHPT